MSIQGVGFGLFAFCYLRAAGRLELGGRWTPTALLFAATTCFGLVHGFGFAGFLMDTGVSGRSLLAPLFGFNLGVEIGQLALLAFAFIAGRVIGQYRVARVAPLAAAGLCGIGVFWFVGRTLAA